LYRNRERTQRQSLSSQPSSQSIELSFNAAPAPSPAANRGRQAGGPSRLRVDRSEKKRATTPKVCPAASLRGVFSQSATIRGECLRHALVRLAVAVT
jgi:hypothetical protein